MSQRYLPAVLLLNYILISILLLESEHSELGYRVLGLFGQASQYFARSNE